MNDQKKNEYAELLISNLKNCVCNWTFLTEKINALEKYAMIESALIDILAEYKSTLLLNCEFKSGFTIQDSIKETLTHVEEMISMYMENCDCDDCTGDEDGSVQ